MSGPARKHEQGSPAPSPVVGSGPSVRVGDEPLGLHEDVSLETAKPQSTGEEAKESRKLSRDEFSGLVGDEFWGIPGEFLIQHLPDVQRHRDSEDRIPVKRPFLVDLRLEPSPAPVVHLELDGKSAFMLLALEVEGRKGGRRQIDAMFLELLKEQLAEPRLDEVQSRISQMPDRDLGNFLELTGAYALKGASSVMRDTISKIAT